MSYPGRGYSLPDALLVLYPIKMIDVGNSYQGVNTVVKAELISVLIDSGLSMRHIYGSWVISANDTSVSFVQFLFQELSEEMWYVVGDWINSWVHEGFDIVEETAVLEQKIQGC